MFNEPQPDPISDAPLDIAPRGFIGNRMQRAALLAELKTAGVELGAYDRLIVDWMGQWDYPTVATMASLIRRAAHHNPAWQHARTAVDWLNDHNGTDEQETTLRLLKLTEEAGEAAQAYIGMRGQNPRKGTTHTAADVTAELADVILTAMVAMHSFTDDPESALNAIVRERARRLAALLDTTPF